ncbi:acyl-CoA dehydrogenase [Domibacillus antri]|uniref:Acyl-CoA dehydrogenase n=1 Tax=Domibacillus antri TaxID=1714264 RepID=A0A1Q8Q7P9_9BACI|nr:acyl-CoA dehydrogenase family protein [Domibacillus antri]OLN23331.1 acyl-CoA dehydrogenase [Domibacillus antri]
MKIKEELQSLIPVFQTREPALDQLNSFPFDNIEDLKKIGYTNAMLPENGGMPLLEFVQCQETIAKGCGATALSIGWHTGILMEFAEHGHWNLDITDFLKEEVQKGKLFNAAASERNAGSPLRGAAFKTTARIVDNTYVINGEKTFTSAAPVLDYFFVSASIQGTPESAVFLVPASNDGVSIRETWDSVAMRGTASHDLILENVRIPAHYVVEQLDDDSKSRRKGWLLHIPACYIGIAGAARDFAVQFAAHYTPASLDQPIGTLPVTEQLIGEMDMKLMAAQQFLYRTAELYDHAPSEPIKPQMAAAKSFVTNTAIEVTDMAMRIVGARSLSEKNPLHRYWQNVRAGLHNPPMDDIAYRTLAQEAISRARS